VCVQNSLKVVSSLFVNVLEQQIKIKTSITVRMGQILWIHNHGSRGNEPGALWDL